MAWLREQLDADEADPARRRLDVEAKRQILEYADHMFRAAAQHPDDTLLHGNANAYRVVLHCLASAYCDRPGYQDQWKP